MVTGTLSPRAVVSFFITFFRSKPYPSLFNLPIVLEGRRKGDGRGTVYPRYIHGGGTEGTRSGERELRFVTRKEAPSDSVTSQGDCPRVSSVLAPNTCPHDYLVTGKSLRRRCPNVGKRYRFGRKLVLFLSKCGVKSIDLDENPWHFEIIFISLHS